MITNDEELSQTMEQLERMSCALAALRHDVYRIIRRHFALLAEGPEEEIRRVQDANDIYAGRNERAELQA